MKRYPLKSVTMRTPFHMPVVGQHETYTTDIAERQCDMHYVPELQMVELESTRGDAHIVLWVPMTNIVKMEPVPPEPEEPKK